MQPCVIMLLRTASISVGMAIAAGRVGDAQIARIDEADELGRFVVEQRVRADRIARGRPGLREAGMDVGLFGGRCAGIAAVAIGASESHDWLSIDPLGMHVADVGVAQYAALALGCRVGFRLPQQVVGRGARQCRVGRRATLWRRGCGRVSQQRGKHHDQQSDATDTSPKRKRGDQRGGQMVPSLALRAGMIWRVRNHSLSMHWPPSL